MGAGYSGAAELLNSSRENRESTAPTAAKESDGSRRQSTDPAQAAQNEQPQSYGTSGFQAMTGQTHPTMIGHSAQSFGTDQELRNPLQSQQLRVQQHADLRQNQASFRTHSSSPCPQQMSGGERGVLRKADVNYLDTYPEAASGTFKSAQYELQKWDRSEQQKSSQTKSQSEYSFKQMPGGFEPRWRRGSFDALPPSSIASDQQSTVFSLHLTTGEQQMPSESGFGIFVCWSFGNQPGVVTALQPVTEGNAATQPSMLERQNIGRSNHEPRELAAQAQGFAQQAPASGSDVSQQPLMRPPPAFEQNGASFSVSEAQNDSQNTKPPPGFEPRYPNVAALPPQGEVFVPQPSSRVFVSDSTSHVTGPYQAPHLAAEQKPETSEPVRPGPEVAPKPSLAANPKVSEHPLLDIQASNNGVFQPLAQSTTQKASHASEQKQSQSNHLHQEMGSLTADSTQQHVAATSARGGFSMEDLETVEQLGANQKMPAYLEEKFRRLISSDSESDSDNEKSDQHGSSRTRAISPPRIVGGIHHASRHPSSRRFSDGGRSHSQSSARRSQTPLQHTQPLTQLPLFPAPPGVVYMPSPYAMARPARAGDETSTAQLNRLLLIAHQDGYMPKHLTLFNDTSHAGFEAEFPQFKLVLRGSMSYRISYEGWARNNRTHVPPRIIPAAQRNWASIPGSAAWFQTVNPRNIVEDKACATKEGQQPFRATEAGDETKSAESSQTNINQPNVLQSTAQCTTKGKEPITIVPDDEEDNDTSSDEYAVDDEAEDAMIQHAIELSRREALARSSPTTAAGPVPKEILRQSKLSAEAAPFMAPATENVVQESEKRKRGSRGGRQRRASSQASTPLRRGSLPATPLSERSSPSSTPARPALAATQQSQARIPAVQQGRKVSGGAKPVLPVIKSNTLAYIPNISATITATAIYNCLGSYGGVSNLELDRRRGWGFVEFTSPAGFLAAVAANPHRIGKEAIRVQQRGDKQPATPPAKARQQVGKPTEKPVLISSLNHLTKAIAKSIETPEVKAEPKIAWPNAPKPLVRRLQAVATETEEIPKQAPLPVAKPVTKTTLKPAVKAVPKAPKQKSAEPAMAEEEVKPSVLLEPPKTPPQFRQFIIPASPPTPRTQALIQFHTTGDQDKKLLTLPEVEEVFENPPIIKKSAKTSKRAVEKAAKKAKALLAKEARAEIAGARLGMGKAVLEQIGALPDVETDVTITDDETGQKIKKPAAPKKTIVKGIEIIPGVEINENHSKDVYVDRSMIKDKFVISRGQLKEVDLEKRARKEQEVAATQLAHKVRAVEMKSRGKALASSSAEDWKEEEDRIAAIESESAQQTRRGSSTGSAAGGAPVLVPHGADFGGWKTTTPHPPPPPLFIDTRLEPDTSERPNTAMSMHSNMSGTSSSFLAPFSSATLPGPKDPSLFVEPEVIPPPLNRHVVPAQSLSEIIAAEAASRGGQLEKPIEAVKPAAPSSWAQLAAGKSSTSSSADTSRRGSSEVIQLRSRSVSAAGNRNFMSRFSKVPVAVQSIKYDTNIENKRTVYILGVPQSTNLTDISDSVSSGAYGQIYKIEFAIDADTGLRLAGVLFREAGGVVEGLHGKGWGAIGYHHALKNARDADYLREPPLWPWLLDAPISVYLGEYPEEELMRRMHHIEDRAKKGGSACVTRRLCLVNKAQLHADWHEEEMIAFCYANGVKNGNVQKCCVHNFGNSTIVFGSVEDAVMMRGKLLDKFKESKGMTVTFSSCPGENQGPMTYKRDNAYLKHLEQTMGLDVQQEIEEGHYREKKRRNSKWTAY